MGNEPLLIGLAIFLIVFIVCREVMCWYWKINKSIALLTEIRDLLAQNVGVASRSSTVSADDQR